MSSTAHAPSPKLASGGGFGWRGPKRIGEGASAFVFQVTGAGGQVAALKVARDDDDDDALAREAWLLAALARRWGPRLLDAGRIPDGAAGLRAGASYVATSWVEGEPLARVIRGEVRDRRKLAAYVAHGVARGLDELHALGIRHGDVKLANVLVDPEKVPRRDASADRAATLIDVGLAAELAGALRGGTPRYLAPEVKAGEPAGGAADLYALGVVLAEILVPSLADRDTPSAEVAFGEGEIGAWIQALVARAPGARPAASWIADRAARMLGLEADAEEATEARRARVRRTYLAVRVRDPRRAGQAISGPPRAWLDETRGAEAPRGLERLDALGTAQWLVALVGPAAASWPTATLGEEGELATRLLALCEMAPPEAWTLEDVTAGTSGASAEITLPARDDERWLTLARALLRPAPAPRVLAHAEEEVGSGRAPPSLSLDLARALLRRGETGRAFVAAEKAPAGEVETALLRAEIARRRGDVESAERAARSIDPATDASRALLARLAWDRGAVADAERELGDVRGAAAGEVRALVAYARGEHERGLRVVDEALREPHDALGRARLEATRGMLEHARGRASESLAAFATALDLASREGAVIEEATYLTGLAAAAVDAGSVSRALVAALRAAVLWERLGRPALAARALLSRAAAFALVGATHEADVAALLARSRALALGDRRAAAFARWASVETRPPGDARAREDAIAAAADLAVEEDRLRAAARLLVWADGAGVDVAALDERANGFGAAARWEWWGARASSPEAPARVLAEIVALVDVPAPVGSRGPALASGAKLAGDLGDGDAARRLEIARRSVADALRSGTPAEHHASLASVPWARTDGADAPPTPLAAAQVEQLDAIVRALSSRDRLKPLLEQVLDTMVLWTGVERGLLLLRAPDGRLAPRAARNLARRDLRGEQLSLSMGLAKRAMEERQAVCATDALTQIGDLHASVHALRLRSVLAVPLVARGDVLGVVYLDDRVRRGAFGPSELAWVRLVASQAALAIADARDQALLRRAVRRAERANARLSADLGAREAELVALRVHGDETRFRYDEIAGRSEPMREMLRLVDRVTASDVPVLLSGESGTGKELVARAIHHNGARGSKAFVSENCGSVPETLLESTLFGHMRGAFTGASSTRAGLFDVADGGTLFLDEIGEMPLSMQTKLLRVLQDGEVRPVGGERSHKVNVRIIGATHRDLDAMVAAGTFREDLYYRLNVIGIRVPPLRERPADIPLLVARFVDKHAAGKRIKVTRAAMDRLVSFPWPGNVRQLENEVRRALVLAEERVDVPDLSEEVARGGPGAAREAGLGLKARVDALEAQLLKDALIRTKGNQTRAAELLGISRFGLQKMMRRLGIRGGLS